MAKRTTKSKHLRRYIRYLENRIDVLRQEIKSMKKESKNDE